jgi:hypothetical protein
MSSHILEINKANLGSIDIDKIQIDEIQPNNTLINSIEVAESKMNMHMDSIIIRGTKVILKLLLNEDYKIIIDYLLGKEVVEGNAVSLGELMFYLDIGDISLHIPDAELSFKKMASHDIAVNIEPIMNLILPALRAENIEMHNMRLPLGGIQLSGLSLKEANLNGLMVPDAKADKISIGKAQSGIINIPSMRLPSIDLDTIAKDTTTTNGSAKITDQNSTPWIPLTRTPLVDLSIRLKVITEATLVIDKIVLNGLKSLVNLGKTEMKGIALPFNILGLKVDGVTISNIYVPNLKYRD